VIPKIDKPDEARFLHDLVARNDNIYDDPPKISDQSNIINAVANAKFHFKIDLSDGYHNLHIIPEHKKHTAFKTLFGVHRTRVMQQGDKNTSSSEKKKWRHNALLVSLEASPKRMSFGHPGCPAQTCVFSVSPRCLPGVSRIFSVSLEASYLKDCLLNWQNASRASLASEAQVTKYIFS